MSSPPGTTPVKPDKDNSSDSDCRGPWIWQLPPKSGPPSAKLEKEKSRNN